MRVVHVIETVDSQAGSVGLLLHGLVDALRKKSVEATVVCMHETNAREARDERGNGAPYDTIDFVPFEQSAVANLVRDADLLHLHGWSPRLAGQTLPFAKETGTPYVISPCGALCDQHYARRALRDRLHARFFGKGMLRRAAAVTAVNAEEERDLRARNVNTTVTMLPYGLNFHEYAGAVHAEVKPNAKENGRCLLVLGPIHPATGYVPFLRALAEIGADTDGWKLVLAGPETGEWRQMLEGAIRRKGGAEHVTFAAAPDVGSQRAWLAHAAILADPSLRIQGPVSVLQAVASGVPVLASTRVAPPGLERVIRVCPPRRQAFKEALLAMLDLTAAQRAAMAREACELGRALFDWSVLSDRYLEFYRRVI